MISFSYEYEMSYGEIYFTIFIATMQSKDQNIGNAIINFKQDSSLFISTIRFCFQKFSQGNRTDPRNANERINICYYY